MPDIQKFTTGRIYDFPQEIEYIKYGDAVIFLDRSRKIYGLLPECLPNSDEVLRRYDGGGYLLPPVEAWWWTHEELRDDPRRG